MDADTDVKVLQLTVEENKVTYEYSEARSSDPDFTRRKENGKQSLALSPLSRDTITTLIKQFVFLSEQERDQKIVVDSDLLGSIITVLGKHLYTVLFKGKKEDNGKDGLEACLTKALMSVSGARHDLTRIELEFKDQTLAEWPWEYLFKPQDDTPNSGSFLVSKTQLVLNRVLFRSDPPSIGINRPVKVLLVIAQPGGMDTVIYNPVLDRLKQLEATKVVTLGEPLIDIVLSRPTDPLLLPDYIEAMRKYTPIVTRDAFKERVKTFQPNIIHFIGHGSRMGGKGRISFVDRGGIVDWVKDYEFAEWLEDQPDLKLVFLQACESALPDPSRAASGMAMQLAHKNIPAVIAMQYKVDNWVASAFADAFYVALADGKSVDLAVRDGREKIRGKDESQVYAFGLPVLYLRSYNQVILSTNGRPITPTYAPTATNSEEKCTKCEKYLRQEGEGKSCLNCRRLLQKCPKCEENRQKGRPYCSNCRRPLECVFCKNKPNYDPKNYDPYQTYCSNCGYNLVCGNCGQPFTEKNAKVEVPADDEFCIACRQQQQSASKDSYAKIV